TPLWGLLHVSSPPVSRILSGALRLLGDHPSGPHGYPWAHAAYPGLDRRATGAPARPCSGWGLPSHPGCPGCWWALTPPFHPCLCPSWVGPSAVCSLWHFPSGRPARLLAGILPCGVRTFLGPLGPRSPGGLVLIVTLGDVQIFG